jgi:hypothetical protein
VNNENKLEIKTKFYVGGICFDNKFEADFFLIQEASFRSLRRLLDPKNQRPNETEIYVERLASAPQPFIQILKTLHDGQQAVKSKAMA